MGRSRPGPRRLGLRLFLPAGFLVDDGHDGLVVAAHVHREAVGPFARDLDLPAVGLPRELLPDRSARADAGPPRGGAPADEPAGGVERHLAPPRRLSFEDIVRALGP